MATLEEQLEHEFALLGIEEQHKKGICAYLDVLKLKDQPTCEHSMRVGLLGARVARHMHLDPKALFYSGLLHDIGKGLVKPETLKKNAGFDEKDIKEMSRHPEYAYYLLRGTYEFTAEVVLRHHRHQENGYPKRLPKPRVNFSRNTRIMIDFYSRMLSMVDFYDAITTRVDDKFGERRKLSPEECKAIILMKNQDLRHLIEYLYVNRIFGEDTEMPTTQIQDTLYGAVWSGWDGKRNPQETRRHITLACALEPLSEKQGCTTRATDVSQHLKLEYFIASAVNIGDAFEELAKRVLEQDRQPSLIYDLAYRAQSDCTKNRLGGRINQGMLEMLIPIVTAQMAFDRCYNLAAGDVLEKAKAIMQNTSPEDVQELVKMKRLAYDLSAYHQRKVAEYPEAKNVYEYYANDLANSQSRTSIKHNEEFVLGFPTIQQMYESIMNSERTLFNRKVEEAYAETRAGPHKGTGVGLTADCAACAIYLVLSHHPKDRIIK